MLSFPAAPDYNQKTKEELSMRLTQQQVDDFNREGWLFLPELYSPEEVNLLAHEAEGIYDTDRPEVWREKSGAPRLCRASLQRGVRSARRASAHDRSGGADLRREGIYASVQDQRQIGFHR